MNGWLRVIAAAWLLFVFVGCGGGESVAASSQQPLTVTSSGGGMVVSMPLGVVCGDKCTAEFASGTLVRLVAKPSPGYRFTGWVGMCNGDGPICTTTMNGPRKVAASFADSRLALTVSKQGQGSVRSAPAGIDCGSACTARFPEGTNVTLTATAANGYAFTGWSGSGCAGTGSCVVSMSATRAVTATFTASASSYALSVTKSGAGTVTSAPSGISCGSTCSANFAAGTNVTLTAAASVGSVFSGWSGGCSGTGTCIVAMNAAKSVSAAFTGALGGPDGACRDFYGADFALTQGKVIEPWPTTPKPQRGKAQREPSFDTCLVRVTNHAADGVNTFARNDYSRRQAFNTDNTLQLVYAYDGSWHLYDVNSVHKGALKGPGGDAEPQWDPVLTNVLYYVPRDGVGMKLYRLNTDTQASTVVGDFAARLKARWPTANAAWTKSEGSPSADGRYWCFMVDDVAFRGVGIFTWDKQTDSILGMLDLAANERPDNVTMSPTGDYCVSTGTAKGTMAYSRDLKQSKQIRTGGEHADLALDANGEDAYVSVDYAGQGMVFFTNINSGKRTDLFPTYIDSTATAYHFSGKAFRRPGWVVMSAHGEYSSTGPYKQQWMHRKVMIVKLAANPTIYNLSSTRVAYNGYWTEPQASVNRDLTKIVWTSNWDIDTELDVDTYMVQIPASTLK